MKMKINMNDKTKDPTTMGYAASQAYQQVEKFRDQELERINELKKPIFDKLADLNAQIDELAEELAALNKEEAEILDMSFKYEALFNEYVMKDIFK